MKNQVFSHRPQTRGVRILTKDGGTADSGAIARHRAGLVDRRSFLVGSALGFGALGLAGCADVDALLRAEAAKDSGLMPDEKFPIPAVDLSKVDPKYFRRTVRYDFQETTGTIVVDPKNYFVYRIEGDGSATRYGANVGRAGFLWSGDAYVGRKSEWATWTPPKEMIARQPEAAQYARGMPAASTTRSAPAPSISTRTAPIRFIRSTLAAGRTRSGPAAPAAASASSART